MKKAFEITIPEETGLSKNHIFDQKTVIPKIL